MAIIGGIPHFQTYPYTSWFDVEGSRKYLVGFLLIQIEECDPMGHPMGRLLFVGPPLWPKGVPQAGGGWELGFLYLILMWCLNFKHSNYHLEMVNFVGQFWSIPILQNIGVRFRCGDAVGLSEPLPLWLRRLFPVAVSQEPDLEHPRSVDHFGTGKPQICIAMLCYVCLLEGMWKKRLSYP